LRKIIIIITITGIIAIIGRSSLSDVTIGTIIITTIIITTACLA